MSLIVGGVAGGIIAFLVSGGFTKIKETTDRIGNTIITGVRESDGKPVSVTIKNNAVISPQFDLVRISTAVNKKPNSPQYELKNESSVIKRIFSISVVPDATLQTEGFIEIHLNGVKFFPISDPIAGIYTDISAINVPIPDSYGLKILPDDKLEVFLWNPLSNSISATIAVFIGELP